MILFIIFWISINLLIVSRIPINRYIETDNLSLRERKRIKKLHTYHGILISQEDEAGNEFFYRNGKKCKLGR